MPPRLRAAPALSQLRSKRASDLSVCPSCSTWRLRDAPASALRPGRPGARRQRPSARARHASSVASTTAINAPAEVPPAWGELHRALDGLRGAAASYVNLSRLQLALRGLEGGDAVVRVAGRFSWGLGDCLREAPGRV